MIKWTTPSLTCTVPDGIEYEYIVFTLSQNDIKVEKTIQAEDVVDNKFTVTLTQTETSQFNIAYKVEAQLNIMHGNTRLATNIVELQMSKNLHNEEISGE